MTFFSRNHNIQYPHQPRAPSDRCRCIANRDRKYDSLRERTDVSVSSSHFYYNHPFIIFTIINIIIYVIKAGRTSVVARERRSCPSMATGNCVFLFVIASTFSEAIDLRIWLWSRSPRDGFSDRLDIVLKRRKWRRGTNPAGFRFIVRNRGMHKRKKPLPLPLADRTENHVEVAVLNSIVTATLKDRIRECPEYDYFTTVALSCHREIVPEVILYYYAVYCNNKYYISTFYKKSYASFIAEVKLLLPSSPWLP